MSNGRLTEQDLAPHLTQKINNTAAQAQDLETRSNELSTQLAQKALKEEVRLKTVKIEPEEWSERSLALATGQGTVNLLSIPQEDSVTPSKTTFIKESNNKIDKAKINYLRTIDGNNGNLIANQSFSVSDYIELKRNTNYVGTFNRIALYDSNKHFLSSTLSGGTFVSGDAAFARVVIPNTSLAVAQMNEGTTLLPFEEYQNPSIQNISINGVGKDDLLRVKQSTNIYNEKTRSLKTNVNAEGQLISSTSYDLSDFISVIPFTNYYAKGFNKVSYYDENKQYISYTDIASAGQSLLMPHRTRYVRLSYPFTYVTYKPQLNKGSTLLPYEDYYRLLDNVEVSGLNVKADDVDFLEKTYNLFIEETSTRKTVVSTTGTLNASETYDVSEFIQVTPDTDYYLYGFLSVASYDENRNFISRTTVTSTGATWKSPINGHYIRANYQPVVQIQYSGKRMINKGTTLLPYVKGGYRFKKETPIISEVVTETKYMLDSSIDGLFKTNEQYADYTSFRTIKSAEVYTMFDNLVTAYPDYLTKEFLGNEATGKEISAYFAKPKFPVHDANIPTVKVFINCGIHGYEHANTLIAYLMLKQICEKWDESPLLEAIRFNVELVIIPVSNPSGWNAFTRKNSNNVDVNRNFAYDEINWESGTVGTNTYAGAAPFDQIEAQLIRDFLSRNKDIDIMYDFHNFKRDGATVGNFLWIPSPRDLQHVPRNLVSKMSREFKKDFDFLSNLTDSDFLGTVTVGAEQTLSGYCRSLGIKRSLTFEICEEWINDPNGVPYNKDVCKAGVESLVNMMLMHIKEIAL